MTKSGGPESQQFLLEVEGRDQSVSVDGVGVVRFLLDLLLGAVERQGVEIFRLVVYDTYEHILRRLIVPHDDSEEVPEILFRIELFR